MLKYLAAIPLLLFLVLPHYSWSQSDVKDCKGKRANNKEINKLTFNKRYISISRNLVTYSPGSDRRSASYTHYMFSKLRIIKLLNQSNSISNAKLKELLNDRTIYYYIIRTKQHRHRPNANMPQPQGGFRITTHYCHVTRIDGTSDEAEVKTIEINPKYLSKRGSEVIYSPGSDRKSAYYEYYHFDAEEFAAKIGDIQGLKNSIQIKIVIRDSKRENYTPSDPNMPSPSGGFTYQHYYCKIISVIQ